MGKKILEKIKYYNIHWFLFAIFLILPFTRILKSKFYHTVHFGIQLSPTDKANILAIILLFFIILCMIFYLQYRIYEVNTGRNYFLDRIKTKKKWHELFAFYKDSDPYRIDERTLPIEDWNKAEGIILGKTKSGRLIKRDSKDKGNAACFARPGSGKTTSQIIPTALRFKGGVFAIDIKGDIYNATKKFRKIKIFDPEDVNNSFNFNPLMGIEKLSISERVSYIENMSISLIPEEGDKSKYFTDGGRDFFCGIALYLLSEDITISFVDIIKSVVFGTYSEWVLKIKNSSCFEAKEYTDAYFGTNEANVAGAYGTAVKRLRPLTTGNLAKLLHNNEECISPDDLENGIDIYIRLPQEKLKLYAPISTLIVQTFMNAFMKRPDEAYSCNVNPIIFLLDEFHQLNFDLDTITTAMATLRSKKVTLFITLQSIAQLESQYGKAGARQIIDCCAIISVMDAQDPESREYFSKAIGTKKVLKSSTSRNRSLQNRHKSMNIHEEREPIFQPADFGNLKDDVIIIINGKYIRAQKTYHFKPRRNKKGN